MEKELQKIFERTLEECSPSRLVAEQVSLSADKDELKIKTEQWRIGGRPLYIIGVGKAAPAMCNSLKKLLRVNPGNILCVAPDAAGGRAGNFISSSHPYPDEKSIDAANALLAFIGKIPDDSIVLFALSGGASSLVCKPADGLALQDIREINKRLIKSGASIHEINTVRKHISAIKGGQLLSYFKPAITLIDLVISDVPDDDLEVIGSGLTTPDTSTFTDAQNVLKNYSMWENAPSAMRHHIQKGTEGRVPETLKTGNDPVSEHASFIIGSAQKFAKKAARRAAESGLNPNIAKQAFNGSVKEVTGMIFNQLKEVYSSPHRPTVLFFYGESTVRVTGSGKGGRNQELALHGALLIAGMQGVVWLSAGTDGVDGPTDATGAIVDGQTIPQSKKAGLNAHDFLEKNDSYNFHRQMGTLLKTGPTGNNLMDVVWIIVE